MQVKIKRITTGDIIDGATLIDLGCMPDGSYTSRFKIEGRVIESKFSRRRGGGMIGPQRYKFDQATLALHDYACYGE